MNSSETINKLAAALVKAQSEMGNAKKDATNPFFKKNYADLNSIREVSLPALNAHGISAIQPTCVIDGISYVETVLLHESGEYISSLTPIIAATNDPQKHGSGLSYARRYALQSIVNIGAEDDDANNATGNNKNTTPTPATTAPASKPKATAATMANIIPRILKSEPGIDNILIGVDFDKSQQVKITEAKKMAKNKEELYSLLNNSTLDEMGIKDATSKIQLCADVPTFDAIKSNLLTLQKA